MVNFTIEAKDGTARLAIEGEVTIACAVHFKEKLIEALNGHDQLVIDCSALQNLDLAGMQLLCAAHRAAANRSKSVVLTGSEQPHLRGLLEEAGFLRHEACSMSDGRQNCLWLDVTRVSNA